MMSENELRRMKEPVTYVRWESLGRAFRNDRRTVVLIDEIDKAGWHPPGTQFLP